jgi:hypothetical protein
MERPSQNCVEEVKSTMATKAELQKVQDRILDRIDSFTHRIETYDRKAIVHDARINDHEARITRLEHP